MYASWLLILLPWSLQMMPFFKNYCNSKTCFNIRRTDFSIIINFKDVTCIVQHVYSSRWTTYFAKFVGEICCHYIWDHTEFTELCGKNWLLFHIKSYSGTSYTVSLIEIHFILLNRVLTYVLFLTEIINSYFTLFATLSQNFVLMCYLAPSKHSSFYQYFLLYSQSMCV